MIATSICTESLFSGSIEAKNQNVWPMLAVRIFGLRHTEKLPHDLEIVECRRSGVLEQLQPVAAGPRDPDLPFRCP